MIEIHQKISVIEEETGSKAVIHGVIEWRKNYPLYSRFYAILFDNGKLELFEYRNNQI